MMLRVFLIAALLTLPGAHGAQKPSDPAQSASAATCATSPDDAAIYSAALTKVVLKDRDDKRQIVLLSQTSSAYPPGWPLSPLLQHRTKENCSMRPPRN